MAEEKMNCPGCGAAMNHHADKLDYGESAGAESAGDYSEEGGVLIEAHTCPGCGRSATRLAADG